jgi:hypothetical protein
MFKKLTTYFKYVRIIKDNKDVIEKTHNLKIDWIYRLHGVVSFTEDELTYGTEYIKTKKSKRLSDLSEYFIKLGILDIMTSSEKYYDENNQIIILSYKPLDMTKVVRNTLYGIASVATLSILTLLYYFYF